MRGAVRVSLDLARHDFSLAENPSRNPSAAAREAELLNLPLKQALAHLVDDFTRKYCTRLLAIERGNVSRAARHAQYSLRGMRSMLERVGLLPGQR